jgi:phage gp36-like protein
MSYATQSDLEARFKQQELIELTDEAGAGVVDAAVIAVALADADAEINGYLAGRYTLPLTQTSPELVRLACDITRYKLYDARATELVKARYDDAISKLRDVAKGVASLGIDQASQPVQVSGGASISSGGRDFSRAGRGVW